MFFFHVMLFRAVCFFLYEIRHIGIQLSILVIFSKHIRKWSGNRVKYGCSTSCSKETSNGNLIVTETANM